MNEMIELGRVGEKGANVVELSLAEFSEFGPGTYHLLHQRPNDTEPYEVEDIEIKNGKLVWNVSETDTEYIGIGQAEIRLQGSDFLAKSETYHTRIIPALER